MNALRGGFRPVCRWPVAANELPEHLVPAGTLRLDAPHDARQWHVEQQQYVRGDHQRGFERLGHDFDCAGRPQLVDLRLVGRTHHDRQTGPQVAYRVEDGKRRGKVMMADDQ